MTDIPSEPVIDLLCDLIRRPSVTPDDAGCQLVLAERLTRLGFTCETLQFNDVTNLWARRGTQSPVLCFAGHTDVVPPGDKDAWSSGPFEPTFIGDLIYGRGSADMKSGLAAMIVALEDFLAAHSDHDGSLVLLITSDEEGRARDGTLKVMEALQERDEHIDWCVLGEPSSQHTIGDVVRIGRRGSLSGMLTVHGVQGHVAFPQHADNPIRRFAPVLAELHQIQWDKGNEHFPPTSFQVVDIRAGIGAPNVTPASLSARFNFRYSTEWTHESLQEKVTAVFEGHDIAYELNWHLSGKPFLTEPGRLIDAVSTAIQEETGHAPELSTGGGTSDGRFISPAGTDVVELGPVNASIHKINEHVKVEDVITLTKMYRRIIELMLL
ncbi:MAG: succinyl-diaminopimelate desuccinylase [Gammaproteobacteria bacterium]|nr:succinyl-diaminopimelate desuccinylase [Gammaproteobacteria bacterium]